MPGGLENSTDGRGGVLPSLNGMQIGGSHGSRGSQHPPGVVLPLPDALGHQFPGSSSYMDAPPVDSTCVLPGYGYGDDKFGEESYRKEDNVTSGVKNEEVKLVRL